MSSSKSLYIKALTAHDVATKLATVASSVFGAAPIHFNIQTSIGGLSFAEDLDGNQLTDRKTLLAFAEKVKDKKAILATTADVYMRQHGGSAGIKYNCDDGVVGAFSINMSADPAKAVAALDAVEKNFKLISRASLSLDSSEPTGAAALRQREVAVGDLHAALDQLATFQTQLALREAERRDKLQAEMDAAHRARADKLEAQYRDQKSLLETQAKADLDALAKEKKEFSDRVAQFDTREAKYMRRDLLNQIKLALADAEKTALSEPTIKKRLMVHWFVWGMLAASGALAGTMVYKLLSSQEFDWHVLAPLSAGVATFVATMVYYLKWNDRWFREHADAEFSAKRYRADILRASWVAELVHEWAKEGKDDQLPPDLIAAFTRNLFRDTSTSRESEHPMDHVTSLMRRATEIEVGKTGLSVKARREEP